MRVTPGESKSKNRRHFPTPEPVQSLSIGELLHVSLAACAVSRKRQQDSHGGFAIHPAEVGPRGLLPNEFHRLQSEFPEDRFMGNAGGPVSPCLVDTGQDFRVDRSLLRAEQKLKVSLGGYHV